MADNRRGSVAAGPPPSRRVMSPVVQDDIACVNQPQLVGMNQIFEKSAWLLVTPETNASSKKQVAGDMGHKVHGRGLPQAGLGDEDVIKIGKYPSARN